MTEKSGRLYLVCGSAGSGKTTLVNAVCASSEQFEKAEKYSTRQSRGPDDDIIHVDADKISENFDLAYEAAGNQYAVRFDSILKVLDSGRNVVFPLTDIRASRRLKGLLGERVVSICIMSALNTENFIELHGQRYSYSPPVDSQKQLRSKFDRLYSAAKLEQWDDVFRLTSDLVKMWESSIPERHDLEIRLQRVSEFQAQYFENLAHFDYTILNYREGHEEDMLTQFNAIACSPPRKNPQKKGAPLFVVSGASGSGKGMLASTLRAMAPHEVEIVTKQGKRPSKKSDKRDGMIAIGIDGKFSEDNEFIFTSHKTDGYSGTEYAFSSDAIEKSIQDGFPQYLVANVLTNPELRERLVEKFGDNVIFLYLWRLQDEEEMIKYQKENCETEEEANARIAETQNMYRAFMKDPSSMNHVLLNTGYPEGLSSQFFHLLDYYHRQ